MTHPPIWRPIETLPDDVYRFLGYVISEGRGSAHVFLKHFDGTFTVDLPIDYENDEDEEIISFETETPDFWHPLPQDPRLPTDLFAVEGFATKGDTKELSGWVVSRPVAGSSHRVMYKFKTTREAEDFCRMNNAGFQANASLK